ncbi:SagB/ThcOx family dehydrogenase [Chromohalobacter canadensis]|uniref:SagB/ThcOx family dehydrogenase n=1 Tax=Chromohalobacter canadensis TaxID=141389 RepID=UPI0021C1AA80|nr:SagB/ThcOx family dehydrogenase [Chromohalobacter canadensis]MCT8471423.1 SagB/ThcOx family dehydrogenase [Chromohalobacter canadensis]MCT8498876.1 SagB/ThcOx family dehydrogenase [Chromohalobacter canadensis]
MASLEQLARSRYSCRDFSPQTVPSAILDRLLGIAQGITHASSRRSVPSAGALYPLQLLAIAGRIRDLDAATYTFDPESCMLKTHLDHDVREALQQAALEDQPWIGQAAGIITICADMGAATQTFADQPPYGSRGQRYAWIEAGAAAQNIQLQATAEGLGSVLVAGFRDEATAAALALETPIMPLIHLCFGWPAMAQNRASTE